MTAYNIENTRSGEELGRWYAESAHEALNALARTVGFEDFARACEAKPALKRELFVLEL